MPLFRKKDKNEQKMRERLNEAHNLGLAYRYDESLKLHERIVSDFPDSLMVWTNRTCLALSSP